MSDGFPLILMFPENLPLELLKKGRKQIYKLQFSLMSSDGIQHVMAYPKARDPMIELPCKEEWHELFEHTAKTFVEAIPMKLNGHFVALKILREAESEGWD